MLKLRLSMIILSRALFLFVVWVWRRSWKQKLIIFRVSVSITHRNEVECK